MKAQIAVSEFTLVIAYAKMYRIIKTVTVIFALFSS